MFFPYLVQHFINKIASNQQDKADNNNSSNISDSSSKKNNKIDKNIGDYVDYEEIKD